MVGNSKYDKSIGLSYRMSDSIYFTVFKSKHSLFSLFLTVSGFDKFRMVLRSNL